MNEVEHQACEVPFVEQLRSVPNPHSVQMKITEGLGGWRNIPFGTLCHKSADIIDKKDSELSVLRQELAQAKEERKLKNHAGDCTIYASLSNDTASDGICTCGYAFDHYEGEYYLYSEEKLLSMNSSKEKLAQMTTAFLTTEDALHNSKEALAALEGKLGEMRKVLYGLCEEFKGVMQSEFETSSNPNPELRNSCYVAARAALEPIKKEEGGK